MIISRARGYVFAHIPKTGGTALTLALEARAAADDIIVGDTPKAQRRKRRLAALTPKGRLWKHSRLADIEGVLSVAEIDAMLCFTLVRNPWDRMVSYYHWLRARTFAHPAVALAQAHDFRGFLNHPQTQAGLVANPASRSLQIEGRQAARTRYLRLEHLDEDLGLIVADLGFRPEMGRANASDRPADYRTEYSDADAALVARLAAEDIAQFGYRFDG